MAMSRVGNVVTLTGIPDRQVQSVKLSLDP